MDRDLRNNSPDPFEEIIIFCIFKAFSVSQQMLYE